MSTTAEKKEVAIYVLEYRRDVLDDWHVDPEDISSMEEARTIAADLNVHKSFIRYRAAKYIRVEEDE